MCLKGIPPERLPGNATQIAYLLEEGALSTFSDLSEISSKRGADYSADWFPASPLVIPLAIFWAVALSGPGAGTNTASR